MKKNKVIVVGAGMSGLTAAAFLAKEGVPVTLIEKEEQVGGLVCSFEREGYIFDGGLRAVESSGLIITMINDLKLDVELIKSTVSLGIGDTILPMKETDDIKNFEKLLKELYPKNSDEIDTIMNDIYDVMKYTMVLLGGDAPVYQEDGSKEKPSVKAMLGWLKELIKAIPKLRKYRISVEEHLANITKNQALIDIIIQHFFDGTPASFALSYFLFYFDYNYPRGGTGALTQEIEKYILQHSGTVIKNTKITSLDAEKKNIIDESGKAYEYDYLIWTADNKYLYSIVDAEKIKNKKNQKRLIEKQNSLKGLRGAESVLSVYLGVNKDPSYFASKTTEHIFYTPDTRGLSLAKPAEMKKWIQENSPNSSQEQKTYIKAYLKNFYYYNTFEVSFPVLRDPKLAPEGKTGLIISLLFDYDLCKFIRDAGWYNEFKEFSEEFLIALLDKFLFPGIKNDIELQFSATPLTIQDYSGTTDGAIVGWSFMNKHMPVPNSMMSMPQAINTAIPDVYQAGQWSYSPAGLPISLLSGKIVANKIKNKVK